MASSDSTKMVIRIAGDTSSLLKALEEGRIAIEKTGVTMSKLPASLNFNKPIDDMKRMADAVKDAGGAAMLTASQQARVNASVTEGIARYKALGETAPKAMLDLEKATRSVEQRMAGLKTAGVGMTAVFTVPLLALGGMAMKAASDYEAAMHAIRSGTGATGEALQGLTDSYSKVFATVPESAVVVGKALAAISARTGETGAALEGLTTQELNFARMAGVEVQPLIQATTRMFGDWSISTDKQSGALDYLFRTTQRTGAGVQELTEVVVQFGAPLRALGYDFEHGVALIAKWEKEGVNLETVLAGLKMALSKFAAAGKDPQEALQGVIEKIKNAKTEAEGMSISFSAFGKRAAVDMNRAIIEGRFNIEQLVTSLKTGTDTINEAAWSTMSLEQKMTLLKHSLDEALVPIGKTLLEALKSVLPHLKDSATNVKDMVEWFDKLPEPVKTATFALGGLLIVVGPLAVGLAKLVVALEAIAASKAYGLLAGAVGTAAAIGGAGALAGGWLTNQALGAAMGGQSFSDVKGNIAAVLGRSGGILDQTHGAPLRFDESVSVIGTLPKAPPGTGGGGGTGETKAALEARKKAIDELAHVTDVLTAAQQAQILSDKELGLSESQIADIMHLHDSTVKHFLETTKESAVAEKEQQKNSVAWNEAYIETVKHIDDAQTKYLRQLAEDRAKVAKAINDGIESNLKVYENYSGKVADIGKSGTELQVAQIEEQHKAALAGLAATSEAQKTSADKARVVIDEYYQHQTDVANGTFSTIEDRMRANGVLTTRELDELASTARRNYEQMRQAGTFSAAEIGKAWSDLYDKERARQVPWLAGWQSSLSTLSSSFQQMAQIAGGSAGEVFKQAGLVVSGMSQATTAAEMGRKAIKNMGETTVGAAANMATLAASVVGVVAALDAATQSTSKATNALSGAAVGASYGTSIWPGYGTAVGAAVGFLYGLFKGGDEAAAAMKKAEEGITTLHLDLIKTYGSVQNLDDISGQLGLTLFSTFAGTGVVGLARMNSLLIEFNAGLERNKKLIADIAALKPGDMLSRQVMSQIAGGTLTDEAKAAIGTYITGQTSALAQAVLDYMAPKPKFDAAGKPVLDAAGNQVMAGGDLTGAKGQFAFQGAMAAAGQMQLNGASLAEIAKLLAPAISTISGATGISSSFADLLNTANDPAVSAILTSSGQLSTIAKTMQNLGLMDQKTFNNLTSGLGKSYDELKALNVDGKDALRMMQPTMQDIWQMTQDFGYAADDKTQQMIDQAVEQGIVGEKFRTAEDKLRTAEENLIKALTSLEGAIRTASGLYVAGPTGPSLPQLPEVPGGKGGDSGHGSGGGDGSGGSNDGSGHGGNDIPFANGTYGRLLNFGSGTRVTLHGWERVSTAAEERAANGGINITVISQLDGREVARNQMKYIPAKLKAAGY